jgi:cell division protein FtsB
MVVRALIQNNMEYRQHKNNRFQRFFGRRGFLLINLLFLVLIIFSFGREFARNWEIQKEIKNLEQQAAALQAEHLEIESLVAAVSTETYLEKEARLKFGLSKVGESEVIISDPFPAVEQDLKNLNSPGINQENFDSENSSPTLIANPVKWWYYFFNNNKFSAIKSYGKQ